MTIVPLSLMTHRTIRLLPVLALTLALGACGDDQPTTPTTPTTPTVVTVTFSGTIGRNGAVTHQFDSQSRGTVTATLTTLGPDSALLIGMSLGTWNALTSVCQIVLANDKATQGTVITGGVSTLGQLCVRLYDVGDTTAPPPFTYEVTIVHP